MIPALEELKLLPQWVGWKTIQRKRADGTLVDVKLPINPHDGRAAKTDSPETWGTYEQARAAYRHFRLQGLGFVFTLPAGIVGIDLDSCIDDGQLAPWARDIVQGLGSYTELSPSGKGLHILIKGKIPQSIKRSKRGVEMYDQLRYFTVTGRHLEGTPDVLGANQEALTAVYEQYAPQETEPGGGIPDYNGDAPGLETIAELLNHIPVHTDYETEWLRILMAVHSAYPGPEGVQVIEQWSPGYRGEVAQKFRSFDRTSKNGVTVGTLYHVAKQYGWQPRNEPPKNLEDIRPPLTAAQLEQAQIIIKRVDAEAFHRGMTEAQRFMWRQRGFTDPVIEHFGLGYCERRINEETGEILASDALTVPFVDGNGDIVNVEYRSSDGFHYETEYMPLFHVKSLPGFEPNSGQAIVVPDSITALTTHLNGLAGDAVVYGLPHAPLGRESVAGLDHEEIIVVMEPETDAKAQGLGQLKDRARFMRLPLPLRKMIAYGLTREDFQGYLVQGRSWS